MLLSAVAAATLVATPSWTVVVSRRVGIEPARAAELAAQLQVALDAVPAAPLGRSVAGAVGDASACAGASDCIVRLARAAGVDRVVALQLVRLGGELALDVSVFEVERGDALGAVTAQVPAAAASRRLLDIASKLAAKVPQLPVEAPAPVPVVTAPPPSPVEPAAPPSSENEPAQASTAERPPAPLEPAPLEPAPVLEAAPPVRPLRVAAWGAGAGALLGGGLGVALGVVALGQANGTKNTDPDFLMRHGAAVSIARGADVAYAIAGALAVTALMLFLVSRDD